MSNARNILPECYADTLLVEILGFPKANHQFSIGQVFKTMDTKMSKQLAVGVTDKDKKIKSNYYKAFQEDKAENGIRRLKHPDRKHYLIEHIPLESFLFKTAASVEVNPSNYGFDSIKSLAKLTKKQNIGDNQNFKQFLNTLHQKNAHSFLTMKNWLTELVGELY